MQGLLSTKEMLVILVGMTFSKARQILHAIMCSMLGASVLRLQGRNRAAFDHVSSYTRPDRQRKVRMMRLTGSFQVVAYFFTVI